MTTLTDMRELQVSSNKHVAAVICCSSAIIFHCLRSGNAFVECTFKYNIMSMFTGCY